MTLKKGETNNPNGRPKGAVNRTTTEIRNLFNELLSANLENIQNDIDKLDPKDRIAVLLKLSDFVIPKLQSTKMEIAEPYPKIIRIGYEPRTCIKWGDKEIEV
jgi:hypothetical protein